MADPEVWALQLFNGLSMGSIENNPCPFPRPVT
jgi:hypothetical protein